MDFCTYSLQLVIPGESASPEREAPILTLTHVTVIDTSGGPAEPDMTVVIAGDRIAEMGKSGEISW